MVSSLLIKTCLHSPRTAGGQKRKGTGLGLLKGESDFVADDGSAGQDGDVV